MELRKLNLRDAKEQWEFTRDQPTEENGVTNPYHGVSFEEYRQVVLPKLLSYEHPGADAPDWFVPESRFYLWDGEKLVGEFRLRHYLTEALRLGAGHIGYSIRIEERGKGYGTAGLGLTLRFARRIVPETEICLRAWKTNLPSQRAMLRNGAYVAGEDERYVYLRIPK